MLLFVEFHLGILPTKFGASRLIVWQWMVKVICIGHFACEIGRSITWSVSRGPLETTYLESLTPLCRFLYNFYGATMSIKGQCRHFKAFSDKKISPLLLKFDLWWHKKGFNVNFNFFNPKRHIVAWKRVFWAVTQQNPLIGLTCRRVSVKKVKSIIFHLFAQKPPWTDLHQIWYRASSPVRNHVCRIFYQLVQGFRFCRGVKICPSPLTKPVAVNTVQSLPRCLW